MTLDRPSEKDNRLDMPPARSFDEEFMSVLLPITRSLCVPEASFTCIILQDGFTEQFLISTVP